MELYDWMEEKHGVTVVMDMLNYNITADSSYQKPLLTFGGPEGNLPWENEILILGPCASA